VGGLLFTPINPNLRHCSTDTEADEHDDLGGGEGEIDGGENAVGVVVASEPSLGCPCMYVRICGEPVVFPSRIFRVMLILNQQPLTTFVSNFKN
jgi:hypothetical protein